MSGALLRTIITFVLLFPHKTGNIVVNLFLLIAIIGMKWPSDTLLGY